MWFRGLVSPAACGESEDLGEVRVRVMGSTGEPDRKRRLSSSVAPGGGAPVSPAKRLAVAPTSEDKKVFAHLEPALYRFELMFMVVPC